MSTLSVVDVSEFYSERGGGVRTYVRKKLEVAQRFGVRLHVLVPAPENGIERVGAGALVRLASPRLPVDPRYHVFVDTAAVGRAVLALGPDVVEASSPFGGGLAVARLPRRIPRALVMHQDASLAIVHALFDRAVPRSTLDRVAAPYFRAIGRLAMHFDATVFAGEWLARRFASFGVPRTCAVPFGIDAAPFGRSRFDAELRARWLARCEVPGSARLLVAASRHHPEKRIGTILRGFARASARGGEGSMGLVLLGDGPLEGLVRARAARIRGVHVAGFVGDRDLVARTLASADLFVHGSAAETYGIVLAEAIASGLPFVAPCVGGAPELADPSYASLYEPGDAEGCARAIHDVLGRDRNAIDEALAVARERTVRSMDDHFRELFRFYRRLAAGGAALRERQQSTL